MKPLQIADLFCGTKTDITKQIGNVVPVNLSRELALTVLRTEAA